MVIGGQGVCFPDKMIEIDNQHPGESTPRRVSKIRYLFPPFVSWLLEIQKFPTVITTAAAVERKSASSKKISVDSVGPRVKAPYSWCLFPVFSHAYMRMIISSFKPFECHFPHLRERGRRRNGP